MPSTVYLPAGTSKMAYPRLSVNFSATTRPSEGSMIVILCPTNPASGSAYFLTSFQETAFTEIWPVRWCLKSVQLLNNPNIAVIPMNHAADSAPVLCLVRRVLGARGAEVLHLLTKISNLFAQITNSPLGLIV